jgi:hypothetical protein
MLMREPLSGQPRVLARCPDLTGEAPVWGE